MKLIHRFLIVQATIIVYVLFHLPVPYIDNVTNIIYGLTLSMGLWLGFVVSRSALSTGGKEWRKD